MISSFKKKKALILAGLVLASSLSATAGMINPPVQPNPMPTFPWPTTITNPLGGIDGYNNSYVQERNGTNLHFVDSSGRGYTIVPDASATAQAIDMTSAVSIVRVPLNDDASVSINASGTWTGTGVVQVTYDPNPATAAWQAAPITTTTSSTANTSNAGTFTGNATYRFNSAGFAQFRVLPTVLGTGTLNIGYVVSSAYIPAGLDAFNDLMVTLRVSGTSIALQNGTNSQFTGGNGILATTQCYVWNVAASVWVHCLDDGNAGVPKVGIDYTTGNSPIAVAAASSGPNVISSHSGQLDNLLITTSGTTGTDTLYDSASACSGPVIAIVNGTTGSPAAIAGTNYPQGASHVSNGITECGGTGSAAITVFSH